VGDVRLGQQRFLDHVIGVVFPMYFVKTAGANLEPSSATSRLAIASAAAIGIVAVVSPVLGAIADYAALKKRLLGAFLSVAIGSTAALWFVGQGTGSWACGCSSSPTSPAR